MFSAAALAASVALAQPQKGAVVTVAGYEGSSTLENFPVLVRIAEYDDETGKGIQGFAYSACAEGGADISFASIDGATVYPHEIDTWDKNGESLVWVRVPSIAAADSGTVTTFMFRWKDSAPPANTPSDVWSAGYEGVWHLGEEGLGGTSKNSTSNGSILDGKNTPTTLGVAGKIGGARQISDSTDRNNKVGGIYVDGSQDCTKFEGKFTISGWFWHKDQDPNYDHIFYKRKTGDGGAANNEGGFASEVNARSYVQVRIFGSTRIYTLADVTSYKENWVHFTYVYDGSYCEFYSDGISKSTSEKSVVDNDMMLVFGNNTEGYDGKEGDISWKGSIDEVRLRRGVTSADWAKAEYASMGSESFLTYGEAQTIGRVGLAVFVR